MLRSYPQVVTNNSSLCNAVTLQHSLPTLESNPIKVYCTLLCRSTQVTYKVINHHFVFPPCHTLSTMAKSISLVKYSANIPKNEMSWMLQLYSYPKPLPCDLIKCQLLGDFGGYCIYSMLSKHAPSVISEANLDLCCHTRVKESSFGVMGLFSLYISLPYSGAKPMGVHI